MKNYKTRAIIKKKKRDDQLALYFMTTFVIVSFTALIIYAALKL